MAAMATVHHALYRREWYHRGPSLQKGRPLIMRKVHTYYRRKAAGWVLAASIKDVNHSAHRAVEKAPFLA